MCQSMWDQAGTGYANEQTFSFPFRSYPCLSYKEYELIQIRGVVLLLRNIPGTEGLHLEALVVVSKLWFDCGFCAAER